MRDNTSCCRSNSASISRPLACHRIRVGAARRQSRKPGKSLAKPRLNRSIEQCFSIFDFGVSPGSGGALHFPLAITRSSRIYAAVDALARAYGPWWLCNDVTRPFWQSGCAPGPEREVDMVAIPMRAVAPCPDAVLRGTRLRGRGGRVTDPSSLS